MRSKRRHSGQAIAEFAPALALLLLVVFLPMLDLMPVIVGYVGCWYMNSQQADLAAQSLMVRSVGGASQFTNLSTVQAQVDAIATNWPGTALGTLAKLNTASTTITGPVASATTSGYLTCYVTVTTAVQCSPFVTLPMFASVPGLGAPVKVSISAQRVVEDATN